MNNPNCIFCKIANKEINTNIILETEDYMAFYDTSPQSPVHVLLIPKKHFNSLNEINDTALIGKLVQGAKEAAKKLNIEEGYRIVINTGEEASQTVFHLHIHILGGRPMLWPPG